MIYSIFFISGISGLIYQIIWVRVWGQLFGNTVYSAALITGLFMFGLGLGAFFGGRFADKAYMRSKISCTTLYAYSEFFIALWAIMLSFLFPCLENISATLTTYTRGEHGWYSISLSSSIFRYLTSFVLIFPPTLLMGATLTFLIRHLYQHQLHRHVWHIGLLYGLNTLGAATGCLLVDFALVPNIGLLSTQHLAAAINLLAGLLALRTLDTSTPITPGPSPSMPYTDDFIRRVQITLFLAGVGAMGIEMFWFRFLNSSLGPYRSVFSILVASILTFMWLGSITSGYLSKKRKDHASLLIVSLLSIVISTLLSVVFYNIGQEWIDHLAQPFSSAHAFYQYAIQFAMIVLPVAKLVALPSFFMGMTYPLGNAVVQNHLHSVGKRAGSLYLGNTLGNIVGSIATGFIFLPWIGMKISLLVLLIILEQALFPSR